MALRVRADGRVLCAAMHEAEEGDIYIDDAVQYVLSVQARVLATEPMESEQGRGGHAVHGEWWWVGAVPEDVVLEVWPTDERKPLCWRAAFCGCTGNCRLAAFVSSQPAPRS